MGAGRNDRQNKQLLEEDATGVDNKVNERQFFY